MHEGEAVPAIALRDQRDRPFTLADFRGRAVVVSFIYTRCPEPNECPLTSAKFSRMQRSAGSAIALVTISLDPVYDTPRVLARYGRLFNAAPARWRLATGRLADVDELAGRLGIFVRRSGTALVHSEGAAVIGPDGRIAELVAGGDWTTDQLLASARASLGAGRAVWFRVSPLDGCRPIAGDAFSCNKRSKHNQEWNKRSKKNLHINISVMYNFAAKTGAEGYRGVWSIQMLVGR